MRIVVYNAKGGSGRTYLSIALASILGLDVHFPRTGGWFDQVGSGSSAIHRYDALADIRHITDRVSEPPADQTFAACRAADLVVVPTFLDYLSLLALNSEVLPLLALSGSPSCLYVIDSEEGDSVAGAEEAEEWDAASTRFAAGAVGFAPWGPNSQGDFGAIAAVIGPMILAAQPLPVQPLDLPSTGETTHLYRHLAADGTLLYVGISNDPVFRYRYGHADKAWAHLVATVDVETFPYRRMARTAELIAIAEERPLHNIADRPRATRVEGEWDDDDEMVS